MESLAAASSLFSVAVSDLPSVEAAVSLAAGDSLLSVALSPEAVAALVALGYSASEAARAVSRVAGQTEKTDELIFLALKSLG